MSNEAITSVSKSNVRPSGRKFVLFCLADYSDEEWSCFPSISQIARYTSQGEKTVRDHLDALEADGIITRIRHRREDGTLGRYRFFIQRRNLPLDSLTSGEKQPKPAADLATHIPHNNPHISSLRSDIEQDFEEFWKSYPNKVKKQKALTAYKKAREKADALTLLKGLNAYIHNKPEWQAWCHPSTWLSDNRWNDEPAEINKQTTRNGFGQIAERLDERSRTHETGFLAFRGNGE